MTENFKDIIGTRGAYQVGDKGTVIGPKGVIKGTLVNGALRRVSLGGGRSPCVHRLVAEHFVEPYFGSKVTHKNGLNYDDRAENLEWVK